MGSTPNLRHPPPADRGLLFTGGKNPGQTFNFNTYRLCGNGRDLSCQQKSHLPHVFQVGDGGPARGMVEDNEVCFMSTDKQRHKAARLAERKALAHQGIDTTLRHSRQMETTQRLSQPVRGRPVPCNWRKLASDDTLLMTWVSGIEETETMMASTTSKSAMKRARASKKNRT